jgi:hypothetical protein
MDVLSQYQVILFVSADESEKETATLVNKTAAEPYRKVGMLGRPNPSKTGDHAAG